MHASEFEMRSAVIGELPRTQRIAELEAWYDGTAYIVGLQSVGRRYPWNLDRDPTTRERVQHEERRPIQVGIPAYIVDTSVGWLLGEQHFPSLALEAESGDEKALQAAQVLMTATSFQLKMMEFATNGGKCGSAVVVFKVKSGYPCLELLPTKFCLPTFEKDGETIKRLRYQFKAGAAYFEELGYEGLDPKKQYWYRCEYLPEAEIVYQLVEVAIDGQPPAFVVDEQRSTYHQLGFVAARWVRNLPKDDPIDGAASYEGVVELFDPINQLVTEAVRSIRKLSDPTPVFEQIEDPSELDEYLRLGGSKGNSVSTPGTLKYLEMEGTGQAAAKDWKDTLIAACLMVARTPSMDPEKLSGAAQSALALELLHGPLLELVGKLRLAYGPAILGIVHLMLRVAAAMNGKEDREYLHCLEEAGLSTFDPQTKLTLRWGPYFKPTPQDVQVILTNVTLAKDAGLISEETAIRIVAPLFGVEDVEEEIARIKRDRAEREKAQQAFAEAAGDLNAEDPEEE